MFEFLLKIWGLARRYRGRLVLGILAGVLGGLVEPLMIASIAFVYGIIFPTGSPDSDIALSKLPSYLREWVHMAQQALSTGLQAHPGAVIALVAIIPTILVLRGILSYCNVYFLQWTAVRAITDLRVRLFAHLMGLSAGFFSRSRTGELMSRLSSDTLQLQNVISNSAAVLVKDPVTLIGLLAYLLWQQPKLTLISMIVMPICMVPIVVYNRKIRRSSQAMQSEYAKLGGVTSESFSGNRVIKAYNLENLVVEQYRANAAKFVGHAMRIVRSSEIPGPLLEFFGAIGVSIVLVYLAMQGRDRPSAAGFLSLILALFAMYRPLKNLTRLYNNLEQARAASQRVFELLAIKNEIVEPANPKRLQAAGVAIEFANVDFSYGDKQVLHNINLIVKPGQLIALVGSSGSGKTTVTNLLLRFYDPQRGSIRIGGIDIRDVTTRDLRAQIAVVTQETVLFNDTIQRNIELGCPGAAHEEILAAAKHAHAYGFIMEKADGFATMIGEKGVLLSGGQRQRLAIARAILKNAPILILDEATSSLDTESERAVQAALEDLMQGRTTLCIAHRLSTIQNADVIVVMDAGRIVETGTHAELIASGGIYCKLHDMQFQANGPSKGPAQRPEEALG
ncbi:MAG TPA: ABC transporter ATP-binding protein [Candidatus Limnocylindrales bacterium]|nr:ABC transporter ATP-binding protein [Candidatus Limnocylindrales bacterium]